MATKRLQAAGRDNAGKMLVLNLSQYEALFAHMGEAFMLGDIVRDAQGHAIDIRVLVANDAFHQESGLPSDALGRPLRESLPQLEDVWIQQYSQVVLTGEPVHFASYNADTRRHFEVHSYRPEPGRFAALFRDVTAQVEMEQALREQQQQLRTRELELKQMITGLPGLVWTTTAAGTPDYLSEQWQAYTGLDHRELVGDRWSTPLHPDDRAPAEAAWREATTTGSAYDVDYRIRRLDGAYRWFNARGVPLRDETGRILRWFGICIDIDDLKRAQAELANAQQNYTALFNNELQGIAHVRIVTEATGQPVNYVMESVNAAYERIIGLSKAEVEGRLITEIWPDIASFDFDFIAAFGKVGLEGGEWREEIHFPPTRQWLRVYAYRPRCGECVVIFSDITAQRQAEQALANSEAELRANFEQAGVGILYVNAQGRFLKVNQKVCAMLGYTQEELARLHVRAIVHPDDQAFLRSQFERALRGEIDSYIAERRYRHKDGHIVWVRITASPVRHPDSGQILYMAKFIEDISERKRARAELEGFFRQATVGMVVLDTESRILRLNQRFCDILGYHQDELQGTLYMALNHPGELAEDKLLFERLCAGEIPEYSLEKRLLCKDGSYTWTMISAAVVHDESEDRPYIVSVVHDIEARKQLELELRGTQRELEARVERRTHELRLATWQAEEALREAEAANQAKSQFLATMSHEIRTPLNGVIGFTGLLLDGPLTEAKRRYADLARQSGESLLHLLNDFLDFSRIEAGRLALEPVDFDLHQELEQVLALVQPSAEEKGLELRRHIQAPRRFHGDAARLRQILLNLLTNAVKFTKAGHVLLSCTEASRKGSRVRICFEVSDTGLGIDAETRLQLFQPFTQANGVSRRFGGTGLGLAICRRLTELMDGEIGFRSKPGEGSTFWVELPFDILPSADSPLPLSAAEALGPPPADTCRGRVLVAEDNSVSQQLAVEVLKRLGCQVDVVGNGREAVEAFKRLPYDLIIMDCDMPVMDGFEATAHIRALEAGAGHHVPIIAMTASALQGDAERCLAVGMDEFMSKPLRLLQLSRVIDSWLKPA
ncbi:MAG: hypothetical protein K0Q68_567 [Moraxellaceae bacterium]|jgi:PAS domain S-box-containing protein|nr:hypothetical protein [Moraxellaceae bacterium]